MKKIIVRGLIGVAVVALAVALVPNGASKLRLRDTKTVASNTTTVSFSPGTNPAFKVNGGFTACAAGRTGHLWQATTITATGGTNGQTSEVRVVLAGVTVTLPSPSFSATVPTSQNFNCSSLSGTNLPYTATAYKNGSPQGGFSPSSGNYHVTAVD